MVETLVIVEVKACVFGVLSSVSDFEEVIILSFLKHVLFSFSAGIFSLKAILKEKSFLKCLNFVYQLFMPTREYIYQK